MMTPNASTRDAETPADPTREGQGALPIPSRQAWVDNLRTAMIFLVVNMHACCTYSHVGGWYLREGPDPGETAKIPFLYWQGHLQSFFMGLLFFIAGHFAHRSLEKRGPASFLGERTARLIIPYLLYGLLLHPLIVVGINPYGIPRSDIPNWLAQYYRSLSFLGSSGPLWFAGALFLFSLVLIAWRSLIRTSKRDERQSPVTPAIASPRIPSLIAIATMGVAMVVSIFLIRIVQPLGTNILNFQLCYFPQYILVFAVGVISARAGWLEALAGSRLAARLGIAGVIGGPLLLTALFALMPASTNPPAYIGGMNASAFLLAFWEQLTGLALGLGCMALFSRRISSSCPFSLWLSQNSFCVYMIHAPILVALTLAFRPLHAGLWTKTLLLTATGLLVSYVLASLLRMIPGVRRVL